MEQAAKWHERSARISENHGVEECLAKGLTSRKGQALGNSRELVGQMPGNLLARCQIEDATQRVIGFESTADSFILRGALQRALVFQAKGRRPILVPDIDDRVVVLCE